MLSRCRSCVDRAPRVRVALLVALFVVGAGSQAAAREPWIRASIEGLGADSYRISFTVHAPEWDGELPPGADAMSSVSLFCLNGAWSAPTNVLPAGQHRILQVAAGAIVWGADWMAPALDSGFDLAFTATTIRVDYSCVVEYYVHTQTMDGWDHFGLLGAQTASGILEARIPAPGETTWFGVPSAVAPSTWGQVKELFRVR